MFQNLVVGKVMKLLEINQPNIEQILAELDITNYEITPEGVNVNGDVELPDDYTKIPIQFNYVSGDFDCSYTNITSLKGAPRYVGGNFHCFMSKQFTSLQYAPREVGGTFNCSNTIITSLKGAPREVGGSFSCDRTPITTLWGAPRYVGQHFLCIATLITSLEGAPREIGGNLFCYNTKITSEPDASHIQLGGRVFWKDDR